MEHGKKQFDLDQFLERYRLWIGGGLIVLILAGAGLLIWRENYSRPSAELRIKNLESRLSELESKMQETSNNSQTNSNSPAGAQAANAQTTTEQGTVAGTATSTKSTVPVGKVNINTASVAQLDTLPGIGPAYAQRIIDYRIAHGAFKTIDELDNVKGIGKATIDKFRDMITL